MEELRQMTQGEALTLALRYQRTGDEAIFAMLLAKYDELLLRTMYEYRKKNRYIYRDPLQELYHIAIIGFSTCIKSVPATEQPCKMPARIKAYVKAAFKTAYRAQNTDYELFVAREQNGLVTPEKPDAFLDAENKIDIEHIMKHVKLLKRERGILKMRYLDELTLIEIQRYYKISCAVVRKHINRALKKIRIYINKGE